MSRQIVAASLLLLACSKESARQKGAAQEAVEAMGFSSVEMTGWEPFRCAKDDDYCVGFRAMNVAGKPVSGVVGCGLFLKGCTVRGLKAVKP